MKNSIKILLTLLFTLFSLNSFAFEAPNPPANGNYVLDLANKLSIDQLNQLNNKIENLNRTTKNEYGVLLLSTMDGNSIDDVAYTTFNKWGIGKKELDNGILLVISFAERKTRIETGKGVEGDLPDLATSDILQNILKPQLKVGKVYEGVNDTIDKCSSVIESRAKVINHINNNEDYSWLFFGGILGFGILTIFVIIYFNRKREKQERLEYERREAERRAHNHRIDLEHKRQIKNNNLKTVPDLPHHHNIIKTATVNNINHKKQKEQKTSSSISQPTPTYSAPEPTPTYDPPTFNNDFGGGFSGGDSGGGGAPGDF